MTPGAALAVAIAEHFLRAGCISIVSTHHTSLKVYAANTAGVLNAAVGFDERTLQPTYELRAGVPGQTVLCHLFPTQFIPSEDATIVQAAANWILPASVTSVA